MSSKKKSRTDITDEESQLFLAYIARHTEFISSAGEPVFMEPTPKSVTKKKKKEAFDATIDLHGLTRQAAQEAVRAFLEHCSHNRFRTVLIIHGKGAGVLQAEVHELLEHTGQVTSFGYAQIRYGGSGATKVFLR